MCQHFEYLNFSNAGKFSSNDGRFTKTVNKNDEGVVIKMMAERGPVTANAKIIWRKNGNNLRSGDTSSYPFENPITREDEGIYEIHYAGERRTGRSGLYRLIVRGKHNVNLLKGEASPNNNVDWVSRKQFYKPNSNLSLSRFG